MNYSEFEHGLLVGVFSVQGSFGGDGKAPHLILRTAESQLPLAEWLLKVVPGSSLHGPYDNRGSTYYQWSVRGEALHTFLQSGILDDIKVLSPAQFEKITRLRENYFRGEGLRFKTKSRRTQKRQEVPE
jgi:hypothetical protein